MPRHAAPAPRAEDSAPDATLLRPVLTVEGRALLDSLTDADLADPLTTGTRLRAAGHAPETVAAALTQAGLRRAARPKLGALADVMIFTRDGLEQATRRVVAERRAERLRAAGIRSLADLGCGIGADALVYARAGLRVNAVERDPVVAAAAAENLAAHPEAGVTVADAVAWAGEHADEVDALWMDPARRRISSAGAARVFDPEAFSPPLSFVLGLTRGGRAVGVKLGPGLPHAHLPPEAEAEWVSVDGDVVEVALWFGPLARAAGRRVATVLDTRSVPDRARAVTLVGAEDGSPELDAVGEAGLEGLVGHVIHEPDGAVIRAGLVTDLGASWGRAGGGAARLLDPHLAYLTTPAPVATPLARGYRVLGLHALDVKALRRWVRERGVSRLDVKKRGVDIAPEELRKRLLAGAGRGSGAGVHATLLLARLGGRRVAFEVEPLA